MPASERVTALRQLRYGARCISRNFACRPTNVGETDLLVCAAELVCSSWCGANQRAEPTGLQHGSAQLRRTSVAALAGKLRSSAWRGPAGALTGDGLWWENLLTNTSSYCDATHEPRSKREVRNQRGFGGPLVTLGPRPKSPAPEGGISPKSTSPRRAKHSFRLGGRNIP